MIASLTAADNASRPVSGIAVHDSGLTTAPFRPYSPLGEFFIHRRNFGFYFLFNPWIFRNLKTVIKTAPATGPEALKEIPMNSVKQMLPLLRPGMASPVGEGPSLADVTRTAALLGSFAFVAAMVCGLIG